MQLKALHLGERDLQPEWMDQPDLDVSLHTEALRGLARINRFSRSAQILWPPIRELARESRHEELSVLDLASGAGDVTIGLWQLARRAGISLRLEGCAVSEIAVEHARQRARQRGAEVQFRRCDAFELVDSRRFDVVVCSLFLHHQSADTAVALLTQMRRLARRLVLVNDLVRSSTGYGLAWLATRVLTRSPVVHVDGPRSVAAAFTLSEVRELAEAAGMGGASVVRRWPCRYLLAWRRQA
jgi:2-polyprenyl-3-methyl-5-hydroxy-6-metoxy-1,4-benzoquinol methylase